MPELPEVESARAVIARSVRGQRIVAIEDVDPYVCRPHTTEDFEAALVGRRVVRVNRRGKLLWCETSPLRGQRSAGPHLADDTLWKSKISPAKHVDRLETAEVAALHRAMRQALRRSVAAGGSHTGRVIPARHEGGTCPRCGAPMRHATVGGRSTWWCEREQDEQHG